MVCNKISRCVIKIESCNNVCIKIQKGVIKELKLVMKCNTKLKRVMVCNGV